ncbi:MAG: RnfABCDGE type electron transport complex subunit G [Bacteroidales bacterium]|nr:RnfABCDGE type electron transport complex subunit G [Bacteroidales bacterium]
MAKKESSFKNMVITLLVVTVLASSALAYINELTKGPIEEAKLKAKLEAIGKVVPEFNNNPSEEMYTIQSDLGELECYPAKQSDKLVGTAISTLTKLGFSGTIRIMVGISPEGKIINSVVLEHSETPGLGSKMTQAKFKDQFKNLDPAKEELKVTKDGGVIDAITASTITSRAYCDAVQRAYNAYRKGGLK